MKEIHPDEYVKNLNLKPCNKTLYRKYIKRIIDFLLTLIGLIVLLPAFLAIAIAIKLDSKGPVFFMQERLGINGKVFKIIKFRTMIVGAEQTGSRLNIENGDKRITKTGSFLRRTSLDEIPQLFNILIGDMSIVGPRPPVTYFPYNGFENYPEWAKKRFCISPGLTGLAQVVYRTNAVWDDRIVLDVLYADTMSFMLDVKLFISTIFKVLKQENVNGKAVLITNKIKVNKDVINEKHLHG